MNVFDNQKKKVKREDNMTSVWLIFLHRLCRKKRDLTHYVILCLYSVLGWPILLVRNCQVLDTPSAWREYNPRCFDPLGLLTFYLYLVPRSLNGPKVPRAPGFSH
jgi:hypothetical protein